MKDYVRDLYKKLSENIGETPEEFHYDYFKLENGQLYYRGKRKPLTTKGVLKSVGMLVDILGKGGLRSIAEKCFNIWGILKMASVKSVESSNNCFSVNHII